MKAGEAITRLLGRYGVTHVFGIPGTHTLELYRGLAEEKFGVQHILAHHEQGAGFMADGYARSTGRPGVCFVITGAGVTNLATPLGEAYADSVPLLVISPVNPPDGGNRHQGRLHEITNQSAVTAPLTAFSATVQNVDEIPELLARAFAVFSSQRPRPVHISVPLPILLQPVDRVWEPVGVPQRPVVSEAALKQVVSVIDDASHPVILAGGGMRFQPRPVVELAEAIGCPVITTVAGRGAIPGSHRLSPGAQLRAGPVQQLLGQSDLAILLATELSHTDHWNEDLPVPTRQIRINLDNNDLLEHGEVIALKGDAPDAASRLRDLVATGRCTERTESSVSRCSRVRGALMDSMSEKERQHWKILESLQCGMGQDVLVFSDMTQLAYTAIDYMPMERANSWHHPIGFGTLGFALPAAMGAAIANPGQSVVVVVGDAGFQYTMQEMPLAAELGLDLKVVLWNNHTLEQIKEDMVAADIPPTGVVQKNPDFKLLAQACDWSYLSVEHADAVEASFKSAMQQPGPVLIEVTQYEIFSQ